VAVDAHLARGSAPAAQVVAHHAELSGKSTNLVAPEAPIGARVRDEHQRRPRLRASACEEQLSSVRWGCPVPLPREASGLCRRVSIHMRHARLPLM
jgi:hypothetical protein